MARKIDNHTKDSQYSAFPFEKETLNEQGNHVYPLVSVIMPVYNGARYISEAIQSVLSQSYANFELIIVNDGSIDNTEAEILDFSDARIKYFKQENKGVSPARNIGLQHMNGDFFCFLDADDVMPRLSLQLRLEQFQFNPSVSFVDGMVEIFDDQLQNMISIYCPRFKGYPLEDLLKLKATCFFGPSWMIRRLPGKRYRMNERLTYGEDIFFCMELARQGGLYSYTPAVILKYRKHSQSAMRNLEGLHQGYKQVFNIIRCWPEFTFWNKIIYIVKVKKIMFLSYLSRYQYRKAFLALTS